jgi:hypothetical protein
MKIVISAKDVKAFIINGFAEGMFYPLELSDNDAETLEDYINSHETDDINIIVSDCIIEF